MDTFHTLILDTYKQFNLFLKNYNEINNKKQQQQQLDFTIISNLIINCIKYKLQQPQQQQNTKEEEEANDIVEKVSSELELADFIEFLICLLFYSGNQELSIKIIQENGMFLKELLETGQLGHGIPFAIAFSNCTQVLTTLSNNTNIPALKLIDDNNGLIMTSSLYGNIDSLDYLVGITNGGCLGYKNSNGDTPLHFAAMNGDILMIERLVLKYGENLLTLNNNGFNVLICAAFNNQYECIQWLCTFLDKHKSKYGSKKEILEHKNKDGETCLFISARLGFDKSVRVLLDHGAEINILNKKLQSPLDFIKKQLIELSNDLNNNTSTPIPPSSDQQLQLKLQSLKSNLSQLKYINQLLSINFKDHILFSRPNFKNITRSLKSYTTIQQLFQNESIRKEKEIEKNLKLLLLNEKKLNNIPNSKKQQQKQQQSKKQQQNQTTTEIINQNKLQNNNNKNVENEKVENQINNNLLNIKKNDNDDEVKKQELLLKSEKIVEKITTNNETIVKTTEIVETPTLPNEQLQQTTTSTTPTTPIQKQKSKNNNYQKSYREEYTELANIYLEQSIKYKELVIRLGEIENYFSKFNESLYNKNTKAEALGLGVAEILGMGLEYLSASQLQVLEGIHKDSMNEILKYKQQKQQPPPQ